jgi:hypothetical protein
MPHPLLSTVGELGGGFLCSPEDLLSEHVNYTHIIIKKLIENDVFVETP